MDFYGHIRQIFSKKKIFRCIVFSLIPALLFYICAISILRHAGFESSEILADTVQINGQSSFLGFLSNIGSWLWISAAAICFFVATTSGAAIDKSHQQLLFIVGMFTTLLAVDDFFLIHDRYVDQKICFLFYALFMFVLLGRYYKFIIEIDGISFLAAGSLLAMSIFFDYLQNHVSVGYANMQLFEEGFKFTGIAMWLYFCCHLGAYRKSNIT